MENKMLPVDTIKIEVEEVKLETSEMVSLGVDQVTWELGVEDDYYESAETASNSIKTEYNNCDISSMEHGPIDNRVLVLNAEKIKSEKDLEDNHLDVIAKPEEVIIKHETHSDIFMDANTEAVSDR
nr:unnamed protein product [Callosobruchus chinensis]